MLWLLLSPALADDAADALARKAVEACGPVYSVQELRFTFVVTAGNEEKARRTHVWRPASDQLTVTVGEDQTTVVPLKGGQFIGDREPEKEAWSQFTNDSYWLLAPCKLMDPGVNRRLVEPGKLELTFDGVGLTPEDAYVLEIDPETGVVTGWSFKLQIGREGSFDWKEHHAFGPLNLALTRQSRGDDFRIHFEGVEVIP